MGLYRQRTKEILAEILKQDPESDVLHRLSARLPSADPLPPRIRHSLDHTEEGLVRRRDQLHAMGICTDRLAGIAANPSPSDLEGNLENLIGFARIPVGVIGPLRINGTHAHGDFYIPMATTEGSLVASYHRGSQVISQAGGATAACLTESVSRVPYFEFADLKEAGLFVRWVLERFDSLQEVVERTSHHCRLLDMQTTITGRDLHIGFEFSTGDASGQNMVTFATDAICRDLLDGAPVQPRRWYLESNMSGDKKPTVQAFLYARGKKVVVETEIPSRLIKKYLGVTPEELVRCWQECLIGAIQVGSIGGQAHVANALTAIFIACGQDVAAVSEASTGLTRMDVTSRGALYASLSLPNLIVGTVGGGTDLPVAAECLEMMGCKGEGKSRKFAEICAVTALAGELSLGAAMASGQFARAHAQYGRKQKRG
jgi:hydroxymethylglutaryl-CoA reductase (NADPH)